MASRYMKTCSVLLVVREIQIKPKGTTSAHRQECLQILTIPSVDKTMEQLKLSYSAGGNVKCCSLFENSLTVSQNIVCIHSTVPRLPTLRHLSRRYERVCSFKDLYMNDYIDFICNSQKLKIIQVNA